MALEAVQAEAGHTSIETTRISLHLADDWLAANQYRAGAEVLDAQLYTGGVPMTAPRTTPSTTGAPCGCSSSASTNGAGTKRRRGADVPGDLPRQDHPLPKALDADAAKLRREPNRDCWSGLPSSCSCAPGCGSVSSQACPPTPSST